jgi:predicted nucleic acid-binding protein
MYHLDPPDIINAIEGFQSLPNVEFDDNGIFSKASSWVKNGMETADAFHVAAARTKFATFDRKLAAQAEKNGLTNVLSLSRIA